MRLWRFFALGFAERISEKLFREAKRNQPHNLHDLVTSLSVPLALEKQRTETALFNRDCGDFKGFSFRRAHIFPVLRRDASRE